MATAPRPIPGRPDDDPRPGPRGPRTPYPVNDPGIADPDKPGSEPDYIPPSSPEQSPDMRFGGGHLMFFHSLYPS